MTAWDPSGGASADGAGGGGGGGDIATPVLRLDNPVVALGAMVRGEVGLPGSDTIGGKAGRLRSVRLTVGFRTEGRGSTDRWESSPQVLDLAVDGSLFHRFELAIPADAPISYDGELIRVRWTVEARTDVKFGIDPKTRVDIIVTPVGGADLYRLPHPYALRPL